VQWKCGWRAVQGAKVSLRIEAVGIVICIKGREGILYEGRVAWAHTCAREWERAITSSAEMVRKGI